MAFNVQVNAISPSMMETDFIAGEDERMIDAAKQQQPLKRLILVDAVAQSIVFQLNAGAFYTGENLFLDVQ